MIVLNGDLNYKFFWTNVLTVEVRYSIIIGGATQKIKQRVKLRDANQQWIATITELFEKTISACKDNHYESKKLSFRTG